MEWDALQFSLLLQEFNEEAVKNFYFQVLFAKKERNSANLAIAVIVSRYVCVAVFFVFILTPRFRAVSSVF